MLAAAVAGGCGGRGGDRETPGPAAGATLAVVGVHYDATLPLRSSPGVGQPIVASPGPLADDLVATGRAQQLESLIWFEVTTGGVTGWADSGSLAYLGETYDATEQSVAELGTRPTADSILELGRIVAMAKASTEDPVSRVTVAVAPTAHADLGEVTYDVVGFPDDAVGGERLRVLGTSGDRFTLKTVEATTLCRRGVSDDNRRACV